MPPQNRAANALYCAGFSVAYFPQASGGKGKSRRCVAFAARPAELSETIDPQRFMALFPLALWIHPR
jgi:hypothetical protein